MTSWKSVCLFLGAMAVAVPAAALDQDRLVRLAEMPVAVARVAEVESVPDELFREFLLLLRDSDMAPAEFVDIVRYLPVALTEESPGEESLVEFVRVRQSSGTTGDRLAQALREEMRVRGVPIDRRVTLVNVPDASASDFFPDVVIERTARDRAHPHGGPPGQVKKELGLQTGAEVVHGSDSRVPPGGITPQRAQPEALPPGQAKKAQRADVPPGQAKNDGRGNGNRGNADRGTGNRGNAKGKGN